MVQGLFLTVKHFMDPRVLNNQGFAALIGVLVFGTIAVTIASSVVFTSIRSSRSFLALQQSYEAKAIARACADSALSALHEDTGYSGSGTLSLGAGSCEYVVTDTGASSRDILATATVDYVVKRLRVEIDQLSPNINVTSWREE